MKLCNVCGWRPVRGRSTRCNADRLFFLRHGRDRDINEVGRSYDRALDRLERILSDPPATM